MFTVRGKLNDLPYVVVFGGPDPIRGKVSGSVNVTGYLAGREGDDYRATPTGPHGTLSLSDGRSVLGALLAWTAVRSVTGDAPDILGTQRHDKAGVVY